MDNSPALSVPKDNIPSLSILRYIQRGDWVTLHTTYKEWLCLHYSEVLRLDDSVVLRGRVRGLGERQTAIGMFQFWHLDTPVPDRAGLYLMPLASIARVWKERPAWDTTPEPSWFSKYW